MRISSLAVVLTVAIINLALWIGFNRAISPGESHYPFSSVSFNPYQRDESPLDNLELNPDLIQSDLEKIADKTKGVRIYTSRAEFQSIPNAARKLGLSVIASAWLEGNPLQNSVEVDAAISLAGRNKNVARLIIGNETQLTNIVPRDELTGYLRLARKRLRTPVSTAEPWDFWINNPEMVNEVDFIAIHVLPYWQEIHIDKAVDYTIEKYHAVKTTFPYKFVYIAETGWPSDGPQRGAAEASLANQARFIREFVERAEAEKIPYNIIEAFDQPWKAATEGRAGEHFGILDATRNEKFPLSGVVLENPNWEFWALSSTVLGVIAMLTFLARRRRLTLIGRFFAALVAQATCTLGTVLAFEAAGQYMSPSELAFWTVMISAQVLLAVIFLTDSAEIATVIGKHPLGRRFPPLPRRNTARYPMVSIHLACCAEPPQLVIETINSLARLDYPNYEVIIVDNNTADESLWRPVEEHCLTLGARFRFYSLGRWPGFKAGALNQALRLTNPLAQVIGVVDADYLVEPNWLTATIPYFNNPKVGVVQAPQEHRGWESSTYLRMENDEYMGFFRIGMVQRNEDNAIIQHGTMTLVRYESIQAIGGWAEWCICEDAELGLRLLNQGMEAIYIDHPLGRGLVPDSYQAYAKQRFRWAYGGMRIMRRYWPELLGLRGRLAFSQRYQFVKGWLPWIGDGLHMFFSFAALFWSAMLILNPLHTDFPEPIFIYPAVALIALRIVGTAWTYATRVKIGFTRTLLAMIAGGALTHKVAKAVLQGLLTNGKAFYRTPKLDRAPKLIRSLGAVVEEIVLALALWGCAAGIIYIFGTVNGDAVLWSMALLAQSLPYCAAIVAALLSGIGGRR